MSSNRERACHHATSDTCFRKFSSCGRIWGKFQIQVAMLAWWQKSGVEQRDETPQPAPACNRATPSAASASPPAPLPVQPAATQPVGASAPQSLVGSEGLIGWRFPERTVPR